MTRPTAELHQIKEGVSDASTASSQLFRACDNAELRRQPDEVNQEAVRLPEASRQLHTHERHCETLAENRSYQIYAYVQLGFAGSRQLFEEPPSDPVKRAELDTRVERYLVDMLSQLPNKLELSGNRVFWDSSVQSETFRRIDRVIMRG